MPLFEYECKKCGTVTEFLSKEEPKCPKCKSKNLIKLIGKPSSVILSISFTPEDAQKRMKVKHEIVS